MEIVKTIVAEDGSKLTSPQDGFILVGSLFVSQVDENGKPRGGLLGDTSNSKMSAYSKKEFIKALMIDPFELKRIAEELMPHVR